MTTEAEHQKRVRELFREEAIEHLDAIHHALAAASAGGDATKSALKDALRAAHSLKGGAAIAGMSALQTMVHNWESCAGAVASGRTAWSEEAFDLLSRLMDAASDELSYQCGSSSVKPEGVVELTVELRRVFGTESGLRDVEAEASEAAAARSGQKDGIGTVRVSTEKLDRQMASVEELLRLRAGGEERLAGVARVLGSLERLRTGITDARRIAKPSARNGSRVQVDVGRLATCLDDLQRQADEMVGSLVAAATDLRQATHTLSTLSDGLHDDIRAVRMLPVETVLAPFSGMVRKLARSTGKHVAFVVSGGDTEVDRDVLEAVKDPVMHLLRNAVDHGIESPAEREAAGKPPEGKLRVQARSSAGLLEVDIVDDGRGISTAKVGRLAVERGLVSAERLHELDEDAIRALIFQDGFSTASTVTDISGRGVGLSVVRTAVERIGGRVSITTRDGGGTSFRLLLPLNLATSRLLLVEVSGEVFAIPAVSVERVLRVEGASLSRVDHGFAFELEGKPVAVHHLSDAVGLPPTPSAGGRHFAVVLTTGSGRGAFIVDRIIDELELVARDLGAHLRDVQNVSGAAVLPTGAVAPILNAADLLRTARAAPEASFTAKGDGGEKAKKRILVVDDSVTTRTLERSILEAAGYEVEVATDGAEALERLGRLKFELVLSDVQMPRVDGLSLTKAIKQDPRFDGLPVILVSSLDAVEHRQAGLDAGADAYLAKGEFEQGLLLSTLQRFL